MPEPDESIRCKVIFSGTVQGVGFRFTTERIARQFEVKGYVRNMPDGRVEAVAEGSRAEIRRFLNALEQAMSDYIRDRTSNESPVTGEFRDFSIRF